MMPKKDILDLDPSPPNISRHRKPLRLLLVVIGCFSVIVIAFFLIQDALVKEAEPKKKKAEFRINLKSGLTRWFEEETDKAIEKLKESTQLNDQSVDELDEPEDSVSAEDNSEFKSELSNKEILKQHEKQEIFEADKEFIHVREQNRLQAMEAYRKALQAPATVHLDHSVNEQKDIGDSHQSVFEQPSNHTGGVNQNSEVKPVVSTPQQSQENFLRGGLPSSDYLLHTKKKPISPFELKAGTLIPVVLITGINSDLPGHILGQVRENVYDSATGKILLVPQGTRIFGIYDSNLSFGQNRALLVWTRLIFPDGSTLNLDKMPGVDVSGYAGVKDRVNHHYKRIYTNSILLSLAGAGFELLSQNRNDDDAEDVVARSIGQQLALVFSEMTRKNVNLSPTVEIRPGARLNILVIKDIILDRNES